MNNCLALGSVVFSGHDGLQRGCTALDGCAALSWRCCEVQHEPSPFLGSTLLRWHDGLQRGGIALDGCSALKLRCCEVQHKHWPCLGQCFGQLASRDSTLAWLEVGVLRGAA